MNVAKCTRKHPLSHEKAVWYPALLCPDAGVCGSICTSAIPAWLSNSAPLHSEQNLWLEGNKIAIGGWKLLTEGWRNKGNLARQPCLSASTSVASDLQPGPAYLCVCVCVCVCGLGQPVPTVLPWWRPKTLCILEQWKWRAPYFRNAPALGHYPTLNQGLWVEIKNFLG
jgi:hypothetical protein